MNITRTTAIVKTTVPGNSSGDLGMCTLITLPAPSWEEPVSPGEAARRVREMGGFLTFDQEKSKRLREAD